MKMRFSRNVLAALVLAVLSAPLAVSAASPDAIDIAGVRVTFADLDIYDEAGAEVLYTRLKRATAKACDVQSLLERGSIERLVDAEACYEETLARSVEKLGSDALTRVHTG